ncbi:MAG TPA: putative quinol monooxygenase [Propionicimonas sp.]|jgi:quinol monooxygenase YgiN
MDAGSAVIMLARFEAREGLAGLLRSRLQEMVRLTLVESGCDRYELHQLEDDPAQLLLIEQWDTQESLDAHMETDHVRALISDVPNLAVRDIEIIRLRRI